MADKSRHEGRAAGRLKPGEFTRISKTGITRSSKASAVLATKGAAMSAVSKTTFTKKKDLGKEWLVRRSAPSTTSAATTMAEAIERAYSHARAEGRSVWISFAIEPSGAVKIASSTDQVLAAPEATEPTLEAALGRARERGAARVAEAHR